MNKFDWDFWIELDRVEAWKAVALSLDIDPDTVGFDSHSYSVSPAPNAERAISFNKRTRLLEPRIHMDFKIHALVVGAGNLRTQISLLQFVGWAKYYKWEVPQALSELAEPTAPHNVQWTEMALSRHGAGQETDTVSGEVLEAEDASQPEIQPTPAITPLDAHLNGKQVLQEQAIIQALINSGLDPLNLPIREQGREGAKSTARTLLLKDKKLFSPNSFDKAWERLRKTKEIIGGK
jgi:hypothetical protein